MFTISRLAWMMLDPANLAALMGAVAIVCWLAGRARPALWLGAISVVIHVMLLNLPAAGFVLRAIETHVPRPPLPPRVDGILVLGGALGIVDGHAVGESDRLRAMVELAHRYPDAYVVFTGGNGTLREEVPEARLVRRVVDGEGLHPDRIIIETRSRNTRENARFTRELIKPHEDEVWILVTSSLHMPRAQATFVKAGWNVIPWPVGRVSREVDDGTWFTPGATLWWSIATRELVGIAAYWLNGDL